MTATRMAISLDPTLAKRIRRAAAGQPISAWLADAAARKLRAQGLLKVVEEFEAEQGALRAEELDAVLRSWGDEGPARRRRTRR